MNFILILLNGLLPVIVQVLIMRLVKGVSGGDIFAYLIVLFYIVVHFFLAFVIFKKNKNQFRASLIGLVIGALICVFLFYNHNNEIERTRKPHVEIGY